ncbi:hypothetical protein FRB99_001268 [Tulasnella sp. 403]|nr:hypothetical protein FRB99_001268 [Tulasnella sp. 403]
MSSASQIVLQASLQVRPPPTPKSSYSTTNTPHLSTTTSYSKMTRTYSPPPTPSSITTSVPSTPTAGNFSGFLESPSTPITPADSLVPSTPRTPVSPLCDEFLFRRPPNHRRKTRSVPLTPTSPSLPLQDTLRTRLAYSIEAARWHAQDVSTMLLQLDEGIQSNQARLARLDSILERACQQLEDHTVYFDARYPPTPSKNIDITQTKEETENSWFNFRASNALVRLPSDEITPLPYSNGRSPKNFPKRLAGLMALTERQVDGYLYGYGQESFFTCLDHKRQRLAQFIGINVQLVNFAQQRAQRIAAARARTIRTTPISRCE